jgi:hypothetical protein
MNFKKWVKSIQTAAYNGARTVYKDIYKEKNKECLLDKLNIFSNFSCMFLNPDNFFQFEF